LDLLKVEKKAGVTFFSLRIESLLDRIHAR
jgi:hypothetical protein